MVKNKYGKSVPKANSRKESGIYSIEDSGKKIPMAKDQKIVMIGEDGNAKRKK